MKIKNNFFLGMTSGLVIGFIFFSVNYANSHTETIPPAKASIIESVPLEDIDAVKGGFISAEEAATLHSNYVNDFIGGNELPSTTSLGGVIGEKQLRDIIGIMGDDNLKYRLYYNEDAEGAGHIGLLFYSESNPQSVLASGPGSYCPMLCD
jgi:hypothetical protein